MTNNKTQRFGHVALVGRPNVGKSTLLNSLIGTHLSIVSPKPQTTRHRIAGVVTRDDAQLVFLDTPGLHLGAKRALNRQLNRVARQVPDEADVIVHVVDVRRWTDEDDHVWDMLANHCVPRLLVINKVDLEQDKTALLPLAEKLMTGRDYAGVHFLCARRGDGNKRLLSDIAARLPVGDWQYADDDITDRSERFIAAEMIREQLMVRLSDELPYATSVEIEQFVDDKGLARISAAIWVERDSQKAIVVGSGGTVLKSVGSNARRNMEKLFGRKVFLQLWVKVRENWSDDDAALKSFGYAE